MINGAKEKISEKKYIIVGVLLLVGLVIAWDVFGKSNGSTETRQIKSDIQSTRDEQQRTIDAITESKRLAEQLRQANIRIEQASDNIQQSNNSIRESTKQIERINGESTGLFKEGKQLIRDLSERN